MHILITYIVVAVSYIIVSIIVFRKRKVSRRRILEPIAMGLIILGIVALCQPWSIKLYGIGFGILLMGTFSFIFASHLKAD